MDNFFMVTHCQRCTAPLVARIMSWFTEEAICIECSKKERQIRQRLPEFGRDYEGCGYLPKIDELREVQDDRV